MLQYLQPLPVRIFLALVSGAITWYLMLMLGNYMNMRNPVEISTIIVASVLIHEIGHAIAFKRHGIDCAIVFLVIAGGAIPLDLKKADTLPDAATAEVSLAGLMGNVLVIMGALLAEILGILSPVWAEMCINLNAALMLFNMVPLSMLDGARFMTLLFRNVSPKFGHILYAITTIPVLITMMLVLYQRGSVTLALPLILVGTRYQKAHADDEQHNTKRMNTTQKVIWATVYGYLVIVAMFAFYNTRNWNA